MNYLFSNSHVYRNKIRRVINNYNGDYVHTTSSKNIDSILNNGFYEGGASADVFMPVISVYRDDVNDNPIDKKLVSYRKIGIEPSSGVGYNYQADKRKYHMNSRDFKKYESQKSGVDGMYGNDDPVNIVIPGINGMYRKGTDAGESLLHVGQVNDKLDNIRLRLPYGSVSPQNAEKYKQLFIRHNDKLDVTDPYTRRIYNLYAKKHGLPKLPGSERFSIVFDKGTKTFSIKIRNTSSGRDKCIY